MVLARWKVVLPTVLAVLLLAGNAWQAWAHYRATEQAVREQMMFFTPEIENALRAYEQGDVRGAQVALATAGGAMQALAQQLQGRDQAAAANVAEFLRSSAENLSGSRTEEAAVMRTVQGFDHILRPNPQASSYDVSHLSSDLQQLQQVLQQG